MVNTCIRCRRLTKFELAEATRATTSPSPATGQEKIVPSLPPEIVREIIRHATNTFPDPYSIHHPSPSSSQSLSPPPPHSHFPYSSHVFEEDREVDRKLRALSMGIKLSVSGVSREWRDVAVEFLFNSVRIRDLRQIVLLWYAFEGDAKRRGEQASKQSVARPGSAPWWIRELWIDLRDVVYWNVERVARTDSAEALPSFNLFDLLKICPNIVVYRAPGHMSPDYLESERVFKQVLGYPGERGDEAHGSQGGELNVPVIGRRHVELCSMYGRWLHGTHYGDPPISRPQVLTLLHISSLDLRRIYPDSEFNFTAHDAIQLPNLVHLALQGTDSLTYATARLILPSLRSVTFRPIVIDPPRSEEEPPLEAFLEKHGLALEELTVMEISSSGDYLRRLDQLCPILQTLRIHYSGLPKSFVPSVQAVGLYGLEHVGRDSTSGEAVISGIFHVFPNVTTIQDLSWRSSVIRWRAYMNWTDPEGAKWREFWAPAIRAVRRRSESPPPMESGKQ
ncbi:hypothetical protein FRC00_012199, partial [Tulasnella sp. 408]